MENSLRESQTDAIDTFLLSHDFSYQNPKIPNLSLDLKLSLITITALLFGVLWWSYIRQAQDLILSRRGIGEDNERRRERDILQLRVELRQTWGVAVVVCSVVVVLVYWVTAMLGPGIGHLGMEMGVGEMGVLGGVVLVGGWVLWMLLDLDAWDQRELHTWVDGTVRGLWRGEVEAKEVFGVVQWVCEDMLDGVWEVWIKQYSKGERDLGAVVDGGDGMRT